MCGRFVQHSVVVFGQPGLADLAPGLAEIQPSYNLAPTQRASVILDRGEGPAVVGPAAVLGQGQGPAGLDHQRPDQDGGHETDSASAIDPSGASGLS